MLHPVRRGDAMRLMASIERLRGRGARRERGRAGLLEYLPPLYPPFLPSPIRSKASSGVLVVQSRATSGQCRFPPPFSGGGLKSDTKVKTKKRNGGPGHWGMPSSRPFVRPSVVRFCLAGSASSSVPIPLASFPFHPPIVVSIRRTRPPVEKKKDFCTYIQGG
jgi:hypothetical protein